MRLVRQRSRGRYKGRRASHRTAWNTLKKGRLSMPKGSIIDEVARIAPPEYEAYIASLSREQFTDYIEYVISFGLTAVGAGIQLRQQQLEDAATAAGKPKPVARILAPEALERLMDHFRRRFAILLP